MEKVINESDEPKLFAKIKYKITGRVEEEVERLLHNGGAEGFSYFSDYVTHCIVGQDPVDTDISDANDLYEVPAVTQDWVTCSIKCNKLLPTNAFKGGDKLLFTGVVASFSKLSQDDCKRLWAMLKFYGGTFKSSFTKATTHLIVSKPEGQKYEQALKCSDIIHVVTPDWVINSVRSNGLCAEILYHPRLLIIEKPQLKSDYQSTAHITGFADDVVPDESSGGVVPSSEILQQLKLRMPWNQPSPAASSASSTPGLSATSSIQKQTFAGSQLGLSQPRPVTSILQTGRPQVPVPQQLLQQQRALLQQQQQQQQRLLHQAGVQQWRPQNQLQQQQQQMGQKPNLQLAVLQQQLHQQQPIQTQQQPIQTQQQPQPQQQPQHIQQHLALAQQKQTLLHQQQQQQPGQQHFIVHEQQPTGAPQQQQQQQMQMVQHQVVQQQQQQGFVTLSNNNQLNWNQQPTLQQQQQQQQQQHSSQFQLRQHQLQQLQQQPQQQIQQRQTTWTTVQTQQQGPLRQLIHIDAATQAQLQQMDPQQRAMFLHNLQKQRQIAVQRQMQQRQVAQQQQQQQQQTAVGGGNGGSGNTVVVSGGLRQQSVAVIRGHIPSGLNPQQQLQWLQNQRHQQQQIVIQQNTQLRQQQVLVQQQQQQQGERQMQSQQQLIGNNSSSVLSQQSVQQPVMQSPSWAQQPGETQLQGQAGSQQQQMAQLRQQQLQLHRFQQLQQKQQQVGAGGVRLAHPAAPQTMLYNNQMAPQNAVSATQPSLPHQPLTGTEPTDSVTVASSTDLFSISNSVEGSAAGQLRLMTAQHHAQQLQPPPPSPAPSPSPVITAPLRQRVGVGVGVPLKSEVGPASKPPYTQTAARVAAVLAKSAAATQPPQHHQRPQFFGHNPNLKLPTDMFLLGCIFLIVEYDRTGDNISEWTRCITEYGGEVELTYTLRVTHIICQTQKHPLVQQGIRDAKRCVTAEWLSDVCLKQQVLPPWLALHFPTPYSEEKPCRNLIISYSGFEGEERSKVKKMIEATGAKITSYFSSHNNILVCRRPDGDKYKRAREWGKSVVNVQWLNEILFGHYSCLQQPDSHKYQQYNLGNPFRIDYILVPHLMAAWKAPLNVTQESFERLKNNPPSTNRRKRPRISYSTQYLDSADSENKDPCMMEGVEIINPNPPPPEKRPCILFSGSYGDNHKEDAKRVVKLGGALVHTANEATHLVINGSVTVKLYCCVTTCKYIVTAQWLADSYSRLQFVDESNYIYSNPELEKQYNFKLPQTLSMPNRRNLFKNKKFFLTPGVVPGRIAMKEMIEYAGGSVDRQRRSLKFMQDQESFSYFVIAVPKDYHLVADVLRSSMGVYSTEFVLTCLLRQSTEHEAVTMVIRRNVNKQGR